MNRTHKNLKILIKFKHKRLLMIPQHQDKNQSTIKKFHRKIPSKQLMNPNQISKILNNLYLLCFKRISTHKFCRQAKLLQGQNRIIWKLIR